MAKWQCNRPCYLAGHGVVRAGTIIDFDGEVSQQVKVNFVKLDAEEVKAVEEQKKLDSDMTYRAKVERLKDAKVKIPRGANRETVDKLFAEHIEKVEMTGV